MTFRSTSARLLVAAALGGALLAAPIIDASPASAAPCPGTSVRDPITGTCWTSGQGPVTGTGGVCMPGRLGLCLGALANSQIAGDNLQSQPAAGPSREPGTWP